jgi:hypothetical protein
MRRGKEKIRERKKERRKPGESVKEVLGLNGLDQLGNQELQEH